ncbi:MAG: glycosyltransferase family 4 protein [Chitinophagaceae bacterium]
MKKILVICPYPENKAPSQRLKYEQYFPAFRKHGYVLTVAPFINESFWNIAYKPGNFILKLVNFLYAYWKRLILLVKIARFDIVYIHLWVTPVGPPFFEWLVRSLARRIIYDIDDLVYLRNEKSGKWYVNLLKGRQKPKYLIKRADHVITCTPYLDAFAKTLNPVTTDISSTIDTEKYLPVNCYTNDKILNLGWSGSFSTVRYLRLLQPVLAELSQHIKFRLLVMGDSGFEMPGVDVESVEWTQENEIPFLQRIDIGLYPLPLDEEWVYGKSGLKALQYMALGIPTIATAIGTNFRIMEHNVSGLLVTTQDDWLAAILRLANDPGLRERMGKCGRRNVEDNFSLHANTGKYLRILGEQP